MYVDMGGEGPVGQNVLVHEDEDVEEERCDEDKENVMPLERHVYEKLFIQETLVDLVVDVADMLGAMLMEATGEEPVNFTQWLKLQSVESRMETVSSMAKQVVRLLGPTSTEVPIFERRISRVRKLVSSLREEIVGWDDESGDECDSTMGAVNKENKYDRAAVVWRSGLHRDDKVKRSVLGRASYYSYPISAFGSLTFGGYDTSRFNESSNLTLAGGSDQYRPFLLGVESITSSGTPLLSEPIITALDSLATQIWLPSSACKAFESAFGLVWNDTYELYLLDDSQHSALVAKNASITFTLSTGNGNSSDRLDITLPYAAFDLKASPPLAGNQTFYYFPLKQAANETQYTLGRTFLQEVYVLADYDRGLITLYEAVYPDSSVQSNIVAICPPDSTTCNSSSQSISHKLSTGAIVGVVIGAIAILLCIGIGIRLRQKKRRPVSTATEATEGTSFTEHGIPEKPELDSMQTRNSRNELEASMSYRDEILKPELDSGYTSPHQTLSSDEPTPLSFRGRNNSDRHGLTESGGATLHELSGQYNSPELEGDPIAHELHGSTSWSANHQRGSNLVERRDRLP